MKNNFNTITPEKEYHTHLTPSDEYNNSNSGGLNNWTETTLGEVCMILSGSTPTTKEESFWGGTIPWITPKDLSNYSSVYISNGERYITEAGLNNSSAQILPKNTILFSSRAPIGYVAIAKNEITTNQGFKNIICDEKVSHFNFFYYLLKQNANYVEKLSSGSTFSEASATVMKSLPILLPPLDEQKAIAAVLSAFDDKIELLREQNKTLEEMGQTIFNYEYTLMNNDLVKADEILDFEKGIEVGSNNYYESPSDLNNPEMFYRVGDISNNGNLSALYCEKELLKNKIFKSDSVLVSFDGTVGRVFIGGNGGYSSGIRKITATENNIKNSFLYFWAKTEETQETIKLYSEGTTIQHAGRSIPYLEIISNQETIDKIEEIIEPIFIKILYNLHQIQSLSRTRDELLPRLMCGELRVGGF